MNAERNTDRQTRYRVNFQPPDLRQALKAVADACLKHGGFSSTQEARAPLGFGLYKDSKGKRDEFVRFLLNQEVLVEINGTLYFDELRSEALFTAYTESQEPDELDSDQRHEQMRRIAQTYGLQLATPIREVFDPLDAQVGIDMRRRPAKHVLYLEPNEILIFNMMMAYGSASISCAWTWVPATTEMLRERWEPQGAMSFPHFQNLVAKFERAGIISRQVLRRGDWSRRDFNIDPALLIATEIQEYRTLEVPPELHQLIRAILNGEFVPPARFWRKAFRHFVRKGGIKIKPGPALNYLIGYDPDDTVDRLGIFVPSGDHVLTCWRGFEPFEFVASKDARRPSRGATTQNESIERTPVHSQNLPCPVELDPLPSLAVRDREEIFVATEDGLIEFEPEVLTQVPKETPGPASDVNSLSDEDLQTQIRRLQLEAKRRKQARIEEIRGNLNTLYTRKDSAIKQRARATRDSRELADQVHDLRVQANALAEESNNLYAMAEACDVNIKRIEDEIDVLETELMDLAN